MADEEPPRGLAQLAEHAFAGTNAVPSELGLATGKPMPSGLGANPLAFAAGLLPPTEAAFFHLSQAASLFSKGGDEERAAMVRKLIAPKKGRGKPPKWTDEQRLILATQVAELWCRLDFSTRSACAYLSKNGWNFTEEALRDQLKQFWTAHGVTPDEARGNFRDGRWTLGEN